MRLGTSASAVALVLALGGCAGDPASPEVSDAVVVPLSPVAVAIEAQDIELRPATLSAPTGHPLIVTFDNRDRGVPHGLVLYADAARTMKLAEATIITGPDQTELDIPGLIPGQYHFSCMVHPNMDAILTVDPS